MTIEKLKAKLNGLMFAYSVKLQQQAYERKTLYNGKVYYTDRWSEIQLEMDPLVYEIEELDNYLYELENENEL